MSLEESIALVEKFQKELAQLESDKREIKNNEEERRKPIEVNVRRRSMFRYFWPWIIFAATELCLLLFISLIFLMSSHPNIGFIMNIGSYVFAALLIVIGIIAMFYFYAFDGALHFLSTAGFVIAIVGGIIYSGSSNKKKTKELVDVDPNVEMLELPSVGSMTVFTSYTAFVEVYKAAGFENIKCIPLGDLKGPLDKRKVNRIGDVTIDGKSFVFYGNRAPKTVPIVITYHSY